MQIFASGRLYEVVGGGSVIALADSAGALIGINAYDEYGIPKSGNLGRFQYTGQAWLPELGLSYYKARMYSPTLGRFMQTDPIGYADGMNWYNYVGGDPVNAVDPSGLLQECTPGPEDENGLKPIDVCGNSNHQCPAGMVSVGGGVCVPDYLYYGGRNPGLGAVGVAVAGANGAAQAAAPQSDKPKPTKDESICTAVVSAATAVVTPELIKGGVSLIRGASLVDIVVEGAAAAVGSEVLVTMAVVGGGIYLVDRLSGGKVSNTVGKLVGCKK